MKRILVLLLLCAAVAINASADVVVGGPPNSNNCIPLTCSNAFGVTTYQQVYSAGAFGGATTIYGLDFYNTVVNSGSTQLGTGTYSFYLSTSSASPGAPSATYSNNIGGDNTLLFSGSIAQPWAFGDTLDIAGTNSFTYNPLNGNLVLTVLISGSTDPVPFTFFDASSSSDLGRVYGSGTSGYTNGDYGLVTGFDTSSETTVTPEPASLLLLSSGIGLVGMLKRRFR